MHSCFFVVYYRGKGVAPMIRYKFAILPALKAAGYNSTRIRAENLLSQSTLTKLRNGNANLDFSNLNTLCRLLNCQPGDLIEYIPE